MFRWCILVLPYLLSVTSLAEAKPTMSDVSEADDSFEFIEGMWVPQMMRQSEECCKGFPVFHVRASAGHYKLTYDMAQVYCKHHNTVVASLSDLREAWNMGMEVCACGWITDRSTRYPMQSARSGCGNSMAIIRCSQTHSDVYCKSKSADSNLTEDK